jgi:hypothetical protein
MKCDWFQELEKMNLGSNSKRLTRSLIFSTHELALLHQKNDNLGCTEKTKKEAVKKFCLLN